MSLFRLEQLKDWCKNYQVVCNLFFDLAKDEATRIKLKEILYDGCYNGYNVDSSMCSRNFPLIEAQRRVALAYLLVRNPETFDILISENVNLFHGTNVNALPSILKYGVNSGLELEEQGIDVTTGEKWSRLGGKQRDFVSFTDVLDISCFYSMRSNDADLSFGVIIGTTVDDVQKARTVAVDSDVCEVGIKNKLPLESIKVIGVPSERVDYVRSLLNNSNIKVVAIDGIEDKFYSLDEDLLMFYIDEEKYKALKNNTLENRKGLFIKLDDIRKMMIKSFLLKIKKIKNEKDGKEEGLIGEKHR